MARLLTSIAGYLLAALLAPPIAFTLYLLLTPVLLPESADMRLSDGFDLPIDYLLVIMIATIPSLLYGGLVLLAMRMTIRPWPPRARVLAAGGAGAGVLAWIVWKATGFPMAGARLVDDPGGGAVELICLALTGAVAGGIYSWFAKRG